MYPRTNHRPQSADSPRPEPRPSRPARVAGAAQVPRARPPGLALTSAARTARARRLPGAAQSLGDLLEMRAWGRGGSQFLRARTETLLHPTCGPASPAPTSRGRGHNDPVALRAASPVRTPRTPAGPRPRGPDSVRPPSARGIRPGPAPLRAEDRAGARLRRDRSGHTGLGENPGLRVEDNGRAGRWCEPFPPPQTLCTYP